jgi:hypothetical protein
VNGASATRPVVPALLADPTWYRIEYALAAQRLHVATERGRPQVAAESELGPRVQRVMRDLVGGRPIRLRLEEVERDALALVGQTSAVLAKAGWRWVGRRPRWYVRAVRRAYMRIRRPRSPRPDGQLLEFLDRTLEPAAVVLVSSCRVEQGQLSDVSALDRGDEALPPLDRRAFFDSYDWVGRYVAELLREPSPGRRRRSPTYRVHYNLACLFSRRAMRLGDDRPDLAIAEEQLRRAFAVIGGTLRERMCQWAWRDPGLEGMRRASRTEFEAIVGPELRRNKRDQKPYEPGLGT